MFETSVPIMLSSIPDENRQAYLDFLIGQLGAAGALTVYLCPHIPENPDAECEKINAVADVLHRAGLHVGVWIGSLGHVNYDGRGYTHMVDLDAEAVDLLTCPSDARFRRDYCAIAARLAACRIDSLMLDDDFRINFNGRKPLCFCENHLRRMAQTLGEDVALPQLRRVLLTGQNNRWREAWLEANRFFLNGFAAEIRSAVDAVRPELPVILCTAPASWGVDGSEPAELARILAGRAPVSMRLSGGPYWPVMFFKNLRPANIIDIIRRQAADCRSKAIPAFAEGDTYPRPRYEVPASMLELYELGCRADGNASGILKYVFDYVACASYETGYVDAAVRSRPLCRQTEAAFAGKQAAGVSVFAPFSFTRDFVGSEAAPTPDIETSSLRLPAIRLLNDNSIPSHFEPEGAGVVFGAAARQLPSARLHDGWLLDLPAAKILTARGVDVGLRADLGLFTRAQKHMHLLHDSAWLLMLSDAEYCPVSGPEIHRLAVDASAEILTRYAQGGVSCAGEYRYENALGQRFVVFPFDAETEQGKLGMFRSYYRQRELLDSFAWLRRAPLEAVCPGHPDLYLMVKTVARSITAGLWNFSLDAIEAPVVELAAPCTQLKTVNCTGSISGNRVTLSRLPAQEFCCFTAELAGNQEG